MSETVLVALITFASGITGAIAGGITAYKVAQYSSRQNQKQALDAEKRITYAELWDAYNAFIAYVAVNPDTAAEFPPEEERLLYVHFQSTCTKAALLSSSSVRNHLNSLLLLTNECGSTHIFPSELQSVSERVMLEMHKELGL